jgi:predicted ATPase
MIYSWSRDIDGALLIGAELAQISAKHEYPFYARAAQMFRGWVLAQRGDPVGGVRLVQESVDGHRARGIRMFEPYWRGLLAECLALAGETREAMREVDESLAFAEESGNVYWNVPLLGLRAELLQARGARDDEIEAWHQRALALARAQGAKSLELRAALGLSRFWVQQGRPARAQILLRDIYGWFTEGFEAPDLVEARALMNALTPAAEAEN